MKVRLMSAGTELDLAYLDFNAASVPIPFSSVVSDPMSRNHLNQIAHYPFSHSALVFLQDGDLLRALATCDRPRGYIHHVGSSAHRCRVALHSATNVKSWLMV